MPETASSEPRLRVRFAPSPNGFLHLGHAYSAMLNAQLARAKSGTFLLRLEDIDPARCRPEFEAAILDDLHWLGLRWSSPVWRQSTRFAAYRAALNRLHQLRVVYPCFCTRGDIAGAVAGAKDWPRDPDGSPLYPGLCRHLTPAEVESRMACGIPASLRLDMGRALDMISDPIGWTEYREIATPVRLAADPPRWGDVLLSRKDIPTSYHVSVVVDDAAQGITDVVRGADLFQATSLHRLLQRLLGLPEPAYHHHRLVLDEHGVKLSKSRNAPTLRSLRESGALPADVWRGVGLDPHP